MTETGRPPKIVAAHRGGDAAARKSKLDDVKLRTKLLLIVTLALAPGLALLFFLVTEKRIAIAFSAKELQGVVAARPLAAMMTDVARAKWMDDASRARSAESFSAQL